MTPAEHAAEAKRLIANAWQKGGGPNDTYAWHTDSQRDALIATALVHATLSLRHPTVGEEADGA